MLTTVAEISAQRPDALPQQTFPIISGLVHDLRQPLSIIEACADYLDLILPQADRRSRQQLQLLEQQIGEANRILHEALLKLHYSDGSAGTSDNRELTNATSGAVTY